MEYSVHEVAAAMLLHSRMSEIGYKSPKTAFDVLDRLAKIEQLTLNDDARAEIDKLKIDIISASKDTKRKVRSRAAIMAGVLKRVDENRPALKYADIQHDKQCVCDGCTALRSIEIFDNLPQLPKDLKYFDLDKVFPSNADANYHQIEDVPFTLAEVAAFVKTVPKKAEKANPFTFNVDGRTVGVNARYLLDALEFFEGTDCKFYFADPIKPLYFTDGESDAIVLPVRINK